MPKLWTLTFLLVVSVYTSKANEQIQLDNFIICKQECKCTVKNYENEIDQNTNIEGSGIQKLLDNVVLEMSCHSNTKIEQDFYEDREVLSKLPFINLKALFISGKTSLIKPVSTLCTRYPSLTDLSLANGEFSEVGNFYNVRCIEKLKLQNMEINNFDWLEYSSTSLVHLKELWLGGNKIFEGQLHGYTFSLMQNLKLLRLNKTGISKIDDDAFFNLAKLKHLDLSNNLLSSVPGRAFTTLISLETLDLSKNYISRIAPFDFNDLISLKTIVLSNQNNQLVLVDREAFGVMSLLETVQLDKNNRLAYVDPESFLFCPLLKNLDLRETAVEMVGENLMISLRALNSLKIDELRCDCQMMWIHNSTFARDNLSRKIRWQIETIKCGSPYEFKGKLLMTAMKILQKQFLENKAVEKCPPSIVNIFDSEVIVKKKHKEILNCRAQSNKETVIKWRLPSGKIIPNIRTEMSTKGVMTNDLGSLILDDEASEGLYSCSASNKDGEDVKSSYIKNLNLRKKRRRRPLNKKFSNLKDVTKINHESKDITNATVETLYKNYDNLDYEVEKENVKDEYRIYAGPKVQKDEPIKSHQNKNGVLHPRKLRAPIITSIQLDSKYISVLCKWSNHGHQLSLPNLFTTVVLMDDKNKPINKKTVPSSKISMLVEQPKYKLELDKYKNPKKICVQISCCQPILMNETCTMLHNEPASYSAGTYYTYHIENIKRKGSVVVALCLCLSIVLLASGIGACSNCTWKNLNERRYSKLKQRNEVNEKVCLHEISAPLVKEVIDGRNKSNLMINTSSSFTYSC